MTKKLTTAQNVQRAVLAVAFLSLTILNFLAELVTLRIFKRSGPAPELPDGIPNRRHEQAAREG